MKLANHQRIALSVVADDAHVIVYLACLVFLLRRIRRCAVLLNEMVAQNELVTPIDSASARLAFGRTRPVANQKSHWLPRVRFSLARMGSETSG